MTLAPFRRARSYVRGVLGLGRHDFMLASFPRSGSTWVRFLLCNLLSVVEWQGKGVDFPLLNQTMVELGVNNLMKPWAYSAIPRVVKTHQPYWPVFGKAGGAIGLVRDPRDVMVSSFHYKKDRRRSYSGSFADFIRNGRFGLEAWFRHYTSWRPHWTLVVTYEDMRRDTYPEFKRILAALGVNHAEDVVREAIRRSTIAKVRSIEASSEAPRAKEGQFARDGSSQQWCAYFRAADLAYYGALEEKYDVRMHADRPGSVDGYGGRPR